jgi:hypothetical protein
VSASGESSSADLRVSGQMAAALPVYPAVPYRSFGSLIAAVAVACVFLGILVGIVTTAAVTRSQLDTVVERINDRRQKDEDRREEHERAFQRDLDDQRVRLTAAEARVKDYEANAAHIRGDLDAIAKHLGVILPSPAVRR